MAVPPAELAQSRGIIDDIDHQIIDLLARRRAVVKDLFAKKQGLGLPIVDSVRETELIVDRCAYGRSLGVSPEFVEAVFRAVLADSHAMDARSDVSERSNGP
jgi:chorismate mutase